MKRIITSFDINEKYIIVPRGLTQKIINLFNSNKAQLTIENKRFIRSIDKVDFTLTLKDEQKKGKINYERHNYKKHW